MLTLQLAACIGMIMGCFILFEISLEDFTADLFGGILGKPRNIQDAIMEETNTRKIPYIKRELLEVQDILLTTGREKQFPMLCTTSFILFALGASFAVMMGNFFMVPVLAVGFLFIPIWYIKLTAHTFKKDISAELETALSIITTSYLRNEDILTAVEESIFYLNPPVQTVFQEFVTRIHMVDPDIESGLRDLKTKIRNDTFQEWCDALQECQVDRSLKTILTPIVAKLSDMRLVNADLEYMVYEPRKEFITMVVLVVANIPLLYFLNKDWFETLTATTIGQLMLSISAASIFFSAARVVKLTKPIEYRR
jgi:tight adherence protein B